MLRSTIKSDEVRAEVEAIMGDLKLNSHERAEWSEAFYEHGQWWIRFWGFEDGEDEEVIYTVFDTGDGLDADLL